MRPQIYEPSIRLRIHAQLLDGTPLLFNCRTQTSGSRHSPVCTVAQRASTCDQKGRSTLREHEVYSLSQLFLRLE